MREGVKDRNIIASNLQNKTEESVSQVYIQKQNNIKARESSKETMGEIIFSSTVSSTTLLNFLIQHLTKSSYDENSLKLMSDLLKTNLGDFNIDIEVQGLSLDQL